MKILLVLACISLLILLVVMRDRYVNRCPVVDIESLNRARYQYAGETFDSIQKSKVILTDDWSDYILREFHEIQQCLVSKYGWKIIYRKDYSPKRLKDLNPSIVLLWEPWTDYFHTNNTHWNGISKDVPVMIYVDDLRHTDKNKQIHNSGYDMFIGPYKDSFRKTFPHLESRFGWVPHSAASSFEIGFNTTPKETVLVSGASSSTIYPLREKMYRLREDNTSLIEILDHPGYKKDFKQEDIVGESYAQKLQNHLVCFTDSSKYNLILAKYFEIPTVGSLLLADDMVSKEFKELGMIDMKHYVSCNKNNMFDKVKWVLDPENRETVDKIRKNGQILMLKYHKSCSRATSVNSYANILISSLHFQHHYLPLR